jgi:hypothetical protein
MNMNKKGMMPMDMRLLLTLLEVIKCICTHKEAKLESSEKASPKGKKGKKRPGTKPMARVPKKVHFEKHFNLFKKHGGMCTTHKTHYCCRFNKDGNKKSNFRAAKKGGKKANLVNQDFAQLTKIMEKLEKVLKKSSKKSKKRQYKDCNANSKEGVGSGSTRKEKLI